MSREKGSVKTGGRKKGTPNVVTSSVRNAFMQFTSENFATFTKDWRAITDKEKKCKIFVEACKFVLPSLQSIELGAGDDVKKTYSDHLRELREMILQKTEEK